MTRQQRRKESSGKYVHHDLEPVEATGFSSLDLIAETLKQVLINDAIGRGEKGENVRDEMTFIVVELVGPVMQILGEIHLLCCPEGGFGFLVHHPDLGR